MKNFRKTSKLTLAMALALQLMSTVSASAQVKDVSTMLSSWWSTLKTIVDPVVNIVSIILGLIGFVKLLPIFAKFLKGEPTSADAFLNHGGGFVIAFVIMQLIRLVII
jgi:ABC-type phosphate transport system permease subunit